MSDLLINLCSFSVNCQVFFAVFLFYFFVSVAILVLVDCKPSSITDFSGYQCLTTNAVRQLAFTPLTAERLQDLVRH